MMVSAMKKMVRVIKQNSVFQTFWTESIATSILCYNLVHTIIAYFFVLNLSSHYLVLSGYKSQ